MKDWNEDEPRHQKIVHVKDKDLTDKYGVYGKDKLNKRNKKKCKVRQAS